MAPSSDASEVLLTFAEIAVAFAGFSSIVAIFQRTSAPSGEPFDVFRFWVMLEFSLAALLFSLLPLVLHFAGLPETAVWCTSSGALIAFVAAHGVTTQWLARGGDPLVLSSLTPAMTIVAYVALTAIIASQLLNLLGIPERGFGLYLIGLFLLLFGAAVNFVRLVWVGNRSLLR